MLAGIGMNFYWPGDGAVPPVVDATFNTQIAPALKEGGNRGGFQTLMFVVLSWLGGIL